MEKLFPNSEVMLNERPTKITEQQEKDYLQEVAEEIIANGWSSDSVEDIMSDFEDIYNEYSGYEIAKKLESYNSSASYKIDTPFIEFLDCFESDKSDILRQNIKDWVKAFNPQPKFEVGQKLIIETQIFRGHNQGKVGSIVYITGKNEKEANYYIHEDKDHNGGYVIPYEKVESNCKIYKK